MALNGVSDVRIGLLGLGPAGRHLLDRISARALRCVAAWDSRGAFREIAQDSARIADAREAVISHPEVDLVLVAGPICERVGDAQRVAAAGKSIAIAWPPGDDIKAWETAEPALSALHDAGRLHLLRAERAELGFRGAAQAIASGRLGPLRRLRAATASPPPIFGATVQANLDGTFLTLAAAPWIDELLRLHPREPRTVDCRRIEPMPSSPLEGGAFWLFVEFDGGCLAQIEVNRRTCFTEQTGWIVEGAHGGWKDHREYHVLPDGEIYETPAESLEATDAPKTEAEQALRMERADLARMRRAVAILHAARRSAECGRTVDVDAQD